MAKAKDELIVAGVKCEHCVFCGVDLDDKHYIYCTANERKYAIGGYVACYDYKSLNGRERDDDY